MAKFNVTRVAPDGFLHHAVFAEIQDSLAWSLASLGHEVSVTQNWFSEQGETNVILGAELIADFQMLPRNSVLFNLEQPSHPNMQKVRNLAKGLTVWEYSHRAVEEWKASGHEEVIHVPIGYTPNLTRIPKLKTQDIDVCFFGWMTPRRKELIDQLKKTLNVYASASCYGGARDNIISRSKVCLNVHHDGRDRFEAVRVSYLMANSKLVVTESSADDDEYQDLKNGLAVAPYRLLLDVCGSYCMESASREREMMEQKAYSQIHGRDFIEAVSVALDTSSVPGLDTRKTFAMGNVHKKRDFLAEARQISAGSSPRVRARYKAATESGDMKDFVGWMRKNARGNVVEIGVRDGASTSAFLSGVEEHGGHVYSIDVQPCGHLFEGHPQWSFLQANSTDMQTVIKFIPFEIDVLLIDGDHSRAGVLNDIEYARQLRTGGMVLFHDIAPEEKPSDCGDMSWPGDDVKEVYAALCNSMVKLGWTHMELPGRYGMGVLKKPEAVPAVKELAVK